MINFNRCKPGLVLGKPIYNDRGSVLLAKGTKLTEIYIKKLKNYNVYTMYIEDELSEGIDIVESFPEELRVEAVNKISEELNTIADMNTSKPTLQGMINSSKA